VGTGTAGEAIAARARRLGLGRRVSFHPHVAGRDALAQAYASARTVVMPGRYETFGLVAFEAAASGASTVACATAPAARVLGPLARTFAPGDPLALLEAIEAARAAEPDRAAAAAFAARHGWGRALRAELEDLRAIGLDRRVPAGSVLA
jgi:alpha-1,6-mannosyltransferase